MHLRQSEEGRETRRLEVSVIGKRVADAQATHHDEGNMVYDACLTCIAPLVGSPSFFPVFLRRNNQLAPEFQASSQQANVTSVWPTSGCTCAFEQHKSRRDERLLLQYELRKRGIRRRMPLVRQVSQRNQPYGIEVDGTHG